MKRNKINNNDFNLNENSPVEPSAKELSLIRARESSRNRRGNIQWFSL